MFCIYLYTNGLSFRKISKMFDISHVSIYNWLNIYSDEIINRFNVSSVTQITDIEVDEMFTYLDKKNYILTAVDSKTHQLVDFEVVKVRKKKLIYKFLDKLKRKYNVINWHTDAFNNYESYFKINNYTLTKDKTTHVESFNSILRVNLPSFVRKLK